MVNGDDDTSYLDADDDDVVADDHIHTDYHDADADDDDADADYLDADADDNGADPAHLEAPATAAGFLHHCFVMRLPCQFRSISDSYFQV